MATSRLVTPAVVVRTLDYGEADRVVTLVTREGGKRSAIARAARKSQKRFGAGLTLFGVGEATLSERPASGLDVLESFYAARGFPGLLLDVAKMAHASYACELVRELTAPHQTEAEIFDLLVEALAILDVAPARAETLRVFELCLLGLLGLRPVLDACVRCGGGEEVLDREGQVLDAVRGGVACGACDGVGRPLPGAARRALVQAQGLTLAEAGALSLATEVGAGCRGALLAIIEAQLGRPLKSVEFIAKLNHASA